MCITNWGSFVLLQIRARNITYLGRQVLIQIGRAIRTIAFAKRGRYYNLGKILN